MQYCVRMVIHSTIHTYDEKVDTNILVTYIFIVVVSYFNY